MIERFFISGPMSDLPEFNRSAFYEAEKYIKYLFTEVFVYNPARLQWDDGHSKDYMLIALPMLLTCTSIFMLKGYEKSKGAMIEKSIAEYCDINIIFQK